jgi:hypothetical protein|tara:strand:- start:161 stop:1204 length:1044 start_codon:yes stop_codon:yes gene_type:complete
MKTGTEIKNVLQHINEDSKNKLDYLVNLKDITVVGGDQQQMSMEVSTLTKDFGMTDRSINQLCGKLKIGRQYIQKCLPESTDLVAHNLNFWINRRDDRELMIRSFDHGHNNYDARAILTNRYKRIDCDAVANHCLDKLMDLDVQFKYSYYDGDRMNITAVTPKVEGEVVKGDVVQGGITITNSEVGNGSLMIKPFIYRLVCTNGMVAPQYFNQFYAKHVGKIIIDPTQDEQWKVTIEKMQAQLELVAKPEVFEENLQKLQQATKERMNSRQIVQLAKRQGITDSERAGIFERLDHYVGDEFTVSKYELSNAVTNMANDEEMSDQRARFFQELGGLIVFTNNPMQIAI